MKTPLKYSMYIERYTYKYNALTEISCKEQKHHLKQKYAKSCE